VLDSYQRSRAATLHGCRFLWPAGSQRLTAASLSDGSPAARPLRAMWPGIRIRAITTEVTSASWRLYHITRIIVKNSQNNPTIKHVDNSLYY